MSGLARFTFENSIYQMKSLRCCVVSAYQQMLNLNNKFSMVLILFFLVKVITIIFCGCWFWWNKCEVFVCRILMHKVVACVRTNARLKLTNSLCDTIVTSSKIYITIILSNGNGNICDWDCNRSYWNYENRSERSAYNCNMLALFSRNIVDYCPSLVVTVSFLEENIMDFG